MKYLIGRLKRRWEDNIKLDAREMSCEINEIGSGPCHMPGVGTSSIEASGTATGVLLRSTRFSVSKLRNLNADAFGVCF
jgi:hypothetical protein